MSSARIHRFVLFDHRDLADLPRYDDSGFRREDVQVSHTMTSRVTALNLAVCTGCGAVMLHSFAASHDCP